MKYQNIIDVISNMTGIHKYIIKEVLDSFPKALMELQVGEKVRTPLGTFTMRYYESKKKDAPNGRPGSTKEKVVARLKEGNALTCIPTDTRWPYYEPTDD